MKRNVLARTRTKLVLAGVVLLGASLAGVKPANAYQGRLSRLIISPANFGVHITPGNTSCRVDLPTMVSIDDTTGTGLPEDAQSVLNKTISCSNRYGTLKGKATISHNWSASPGGETLTIFVTVSLFFPSGGFVLDSKVLPVRYPLGGRQSGGEVVSSFVNGVGGGSADLLFGWEQQFV